MMASFHIFGQGYKRQRNVLSGKTSHLRKPKNNVNVSKCALEENLLSSSHGVQVAENQAQALIM